MLLGGYVLDEVGVNALARGASLVALVPIAFVFLLGRVPARAAPTAGEA